MALRHTVSPKAFHGIYLEKLRLLKGFARSLQQDKR